MAQKVTILLVDDIDGTEAEETVTFGLDGTTYEIDLSGENAGELRGALASFVSAARPTNGSKRRRRKTSALTSVPEPVTVTAPVERTDPAIIRAWAKEQGIKIGDKGRVARSIVEQYEQAMAKEEHEELVS